MSNSKKIILDLCGGTGSWAKPYKDAGYQVVTITLPEWNVINHIIQGRTLYFFKYNGQDSLMIDLDSIYGILAAPPCTMFSFARTNAKKPRDLREGMECVRACLDIIWTVNEVKQHTGMKRLPLKFWALENPNRGFLKQFLGKPSCIFNPWQFGDGYKKETGIWGYFKEPIDTHYFAPDLKKFDRLKTKEIHPERYGELNRTERRAITPEGFAKAFFKANK